MNNSYGPLDRKSALLAKQRKTYRHDAAPAEDLPRAEAIRLDIADEKERRDMYSMPLLVGGMITQFFGFVADLKLAQVGCIVMGALLFALGLYLFIKHQCRIRRLRDELAKL